MAQHTYSSEGTRCCPWLVAQENPRNSSKTVSCPVLWGSEVRASCIVKNSRSTYLYTHTYVCKLTYIYMYMYIYICIHIYIYIYVYIYNYIHMYAYTHRSVYKPTSMYTKMPTRTCTILCMCIYICVCINQAANLLSKACCVPRKRNLNPSPTWRSRIVPTRPELCL